MTITNDSLQPNADYRFFIPYDIVRSPPVCYAGNVEGYQRKVIVYGDSLILEGVRARLGVCTDIKIIHLTPPCISQAKEVMAQGPVALIFDITAGKPDFPGFLLLQPDLLLIGIDPEAHQALVWTGRQAAVVGAADLLNVIHQEDSQLLGKAISPTQGKEEH